MPLIFSIIYYEPPIDEFGKYTDKDIKNKKLIGCILIKIKYNADMLLFVFSKYDNKKYGWVYKHDTNLDKKTIVVNFRSNLVDLYISIFDTIKITYIELEILYKMKKKGIIYVYKVGETNQYLFSRYNISEIKTKYGQLGLNDAETKKLKSVSFFYDMAKQYYTFQEQPKYDIVAEGGNYMLNKKNYIKLCKLYK